MYFLLKIKINIKFYTKKILQRKQIIDFFLAGNNRRLVTKRFQYNHIKMTGDLEAKKWKLLITRSRTPSNSQQAPFHLTLQAPNSIQPNYGKFEITCQNEHNILRRFIESMEDLSDNYTIEFFTFDELSVNIYHYRENFNKNNGRILTEDFLLFSIHIIQPLQGLDILKKIKRTKEPTIISLNSTGKIPKKKQENSLKKPKEQTNEPVITENKKTKSPINQDDSTTRTSLDNTQTVRYFREHFCHRIII